MVYLILRVVLVALALILVAEVVPGISVSDFPTAIMVAIVLGILNLIVRPILVILTLPITIITLGLFMFVINALILMLAAAVVSGFHVDGFLAALFGSLLISIASGIIHTILK